MYAPDDVILGKLIVSMDHLGFGPKDGYNPEDLRVIADFVRDYVRKSQRNFYQTSLERRHRRKSRRKYQIPGNYELVFLSP